MTPASPLEATTAAKREAFRRLHASGCFVIPNPWDVGSARYLESLGFPALATTSSGLAWSLGLADNRVPLDEVLRHCEAMAAAVDVPINADFEGGFATDPAGVTANVRLAAATGIAGLSIEDSTGDAAEPLYAFEHAVERIAAAREALAGTDVLLVARSEGFIVGRPDLDETVRRLQSFAAAGADCLYAPGVKAREHIEAIVRAVAPKPVNVLMGSDHLTVTDLAALGVRRISVGGALARTAWVGFMAAAREIARDGTFHGLKLATTSAEIEAGFRR